MALSSELQGRIDKVYDNLLGLKQPSSQFPQHPSHHDVDALFDQIDTNNDGVISRDEWDAHTLPPRGGRAASSSRSTSPSPARVMS